MASRRDTRRFRFGKGPGKRPFLSGNLPNQRSCARFLCGEDDTDSRAERLPKATCRLICFRSEAAVGAGTAVDANGPAPGADAISAGELTITVPANPIPPPSQSEIQAIIADARKRAVGYADSLPNFICVEVTDLVGRRDGEGRMEA